MGLFQNLLDTYERSENAIGVVGSVKDGIIDENKTLVPIFHTIFKSKFCIWLDENGHFFSATRDKKDLAIVIPSTEDSEGRTGNIVAHGLCDKLEYVSTLNPKALNAYLDQLNKWRLFAFGNAKKILDSIYTYVNNKSILTDLFENNLFEPKEVYLDVNGDLAFITKVNNSGNEEFVVKNFGLRFIVEVSGKLHEVWTEKDLRDQWIGYQKELINEKQIPLIFDYISGQRVEIIGQKHPKKILPNMANAKLFSCNDTSGFTFRGRFASQDDAVLIDFINSQKIHQMLRWLIANYGYSVENQVIIAWAVDSNKEVRAKLYENSYSLFEDTQSDIQTEEEKLEEVKGQIYADYAIKLRRVFQGFRNANTLKRHARRICIAAFDAATTGRMGLVFYQELAEDEYLEKIVQWHEDTSYFLTAWKKPSDETGEQKSSPVEYVGAPSYDEIIFAIYGRNRGDNSYDTLKKKTRKQLLECMFGNFAFPKNMVEMAANRASHPMSFTDKNGKFSENDWRRSVNISCALIRKYYIKETEEIPLELEKDRTDRDYLFGRLLAVADKLEGTALYKADKQETRTTNAIKLMSAFQVKPYSTWGQLYNQLIPYRNQLYGAGYYQSLIDEIMVLFKSGDFENNAPLSPLYLLGYSAQSRALMKKNKIDQLEETDNDDTAEQN